MAARAENGNGIRRANPLEERLKPAEPVPIDLERVVSGVLAGDEECSILFNAHLDQILAPDFASLGGNGQDLLQDTKTALFQGLEFFDPNLNPERDFNSSLGAWAKAAGRNKRRDHFRKERKRRGQIPLDNNVSLEQPDNRQPKFEIRREDVSSILRLKVEQILTENKTPAMQKETVKLTMEGKNQEEIRRLTGSKSVASVRAQLSKARKILEEKLIFPAGFRSLPSYCDNTISYSDLLKGAQKGKIQVLKFLGLYYATPESVQKYQIAHSRKIDPLLLSQGYIPLRKMSKMSPAEYVTLANSNLVLKQNGILYIDPNALLELKRERAARVSRSKPRVLGVIPDGYVPLWDLSRTGTEYWRLSRAVKKGKLPYIKVRRRILVTPEAVENFLKSQVGKRNKK